MNLQEQIHRIQEVMGLDESRTISPLIRRRMDDLDKIIKSTYLWLNPKMFSDLDEFINRVIFSSTRDFSLEIGLGIQNYDELLIIRDDIEKSVKEVVMTKYRDQIEKYYNLHTL